MSFLSSPRDISHAAEVNEGWFVAAAEAASWGPQLDDAAEVCAAALAFPPSLRCRLRAAICGVQLPLPAMWETWNRILRAPPARLTKAAADVQRVMARGSRSSIVDDRREDEGASGEVADQDYLAAQLLLAFCSGAAAGRAGAHDVEVCATLVLLALLLAPAGSGSGGEGPPHTVAGVARAKLLHITCALSVGASPIAQLWIAALFEHLPRETGYFAGFTAPALLLLQEQRGKQRSGGDPSATTWITNFISQRVITAVVRHWHELAWRGTESSAVAHEEGAPAAVAIGSVGVSSALLQRELLNLLSVCIGLNAASHAFAEEVCSDVAELMHVVAPPGRHQQHQHSRCSAGPVATPDAGRRRREGPEDENPSSGPCARAQRLEHQPRRRHSGGGNGGASPLDAVRMSGGRFMGTHDDDDVWEDM